jgi:lysozyme family protein
MDYDQAFDRLMGNEGGYVDNPKDPGGETNWGITWPILREAIGMGLIPAGTTIASLTRPQAKIIYREIFWDRAHMDEYDGSIAFQVFDAAVNHGIHNAVRILQRAAGVADDGHIGPITIAAVKAKSVTDMLMLFVAYRIRFWTALSTWVTFGRGWANRAADDLIYASEDS